MNDNEKNITWIYCNSCKRNTRHSLVSTYQFNESEDIEEMGKTIYWEDGWNIWQCRGCNTLTAEKTTYFSENVCFDEDGKVYHDAYKEYFPSRNKEFLKEKEYKKIPHNLKVLYTEIITSYNNASYILCSMGLRALIEGICVEKGVLGDNLLRKIDNAEFIPTNIRSNLHGFRFLGNNAAHNLFIPEPEDLQIAILVIEDILNIVYDLDYRSKLIYDKFKK